uniref:Retrotransposon Copia-like N-terminal domain-containing protein n=1 Tax=Phaseolus vulgaris TaxID=3885 RepID=V7B4V9_PHAVU|nr:hypothetical protein PHAVU_008G146500g [Phaseolus vulgaris]ESW12839.1 hypothetical protein PHAVU_008G146500g [Phaseolus vulgaris]
MVQTVNHFTNSFNLYYVSNNENFAMVLIPSLLTENNYHEWARSMQISPQSKSKLRFINESLLPSPLDNPLQEMWNQCKKMVVSWLRSAMAISITKSIFWMHLSVDVWNDVHNRFSQSGNFHITTW